MHRLHAPHLVRSGFGIQFVHRKPAIPQRAEGFLSIYFHPLYEKSPLEKHGKKDKRWTMIATKDNSLLMFWRHHIATYCSYYYLTQSCIYKHQPAVADLIFIINSKQDSNY